MITFLIFAQASQASEFDYQTSGTVVAIGDINGDYVQLVSLLREIELIDVATNWAGGNSHLVSLGNLVGYDGQKVIQLFMKLEGQAEKAGGRVHVLLGDADYDALTNPSEMASAQRSWLQDLPVIIKLNARIYTYGGIAYSFVEQSLKSINDHAHLQLLNANKASTDAEAQLPLDEHVIRYRGTAMCHPYAESFNVERFLKRRQVSQIVIGHVVTDGRVLSRMNGLVVLLDTGMSEAGSAAVLVDPPGEEPYVHYLGRDNKFSISDEENSLAKNISGMTDLEVEELLRMSPVVKTE